MINRCGEQFEVAAFGRHMRQIANVEELAGLA